MSSSRKNVSSLLKSASSTASSSTTSLAEEDHFSPPSPSTSQLALERLAEGLRKHPELLEQYATLKNVRQEHATCEPPRRPARTRHKMEALRVLVERRVELMEKLVEARAERACEKVPWLQPIEAWVSERCKDYHARGYSSDSELNGRPPAKRTARKVS